MLYKDMRRADRRWRSRCVFVRRLKNDWATHGWNWNYLGMRSVKFIRLGIAPSAACSIWAETTLCECFWNPGFNGMGRFKDTPHPRCGECSESGTHGIESRPIQEWRELGRAIGDEAREYWNRTCKTPDRLMLVRQACRCGFLMKKFWKPAGKILWSDKRSEKYCPDCERRYGPKKKAIDVPA